MEIILFFITCFILFQYMQMVFLIRSDVDWLAYSKGMFVNGFFGIITGVFALAIKESPYAVDVVFCSACVAALIQYACMQKKQCEFICGFLASVILFAIIFSIYLTVSTQHLEGMLEPRFIYASFVAVLASLSMHSYVRKKDVRQFYLLQLAPIVFCSFGLLHGACVVLSYNWQMFGIMEFDEWGRAFSIITAAAIVLMAIPGMIILLSLRIRYKQNLNLGPQPLYFSRIGKKHLQYAFVQVAIWIAIYWFVMN